MKKKLVFFLLLLTSCNSLPYPTKEISKDILLDRKEIQKRYNIDEQWWKIYQNDKLNALVEQVLKNNINLKKSALQVNQALYQANLLEADLIPKFNGSFSASSEKNFDATIPMQTRFSGQLGLSYELDLWQKLSASATAQLWEYQASWQDLFSTRLTLINNSIDAYFNLSYLKQAMELAMQSMEQYKKLKKITEEKYKHGKIASIELVQAEQSFHVAQNNWQQLEHEYQNILRVLRNLLNVLPNDNIDIVTSRLEDLPSTTIDLSVPLSVLANRPDLMAAEFRLHSSFEQLKVERRSWYPTITLNLGLSQSANQLGKLFSLPLGSASISVNLPFLQWKALIVRNKKAKASLETAKLNFEQTLVSAINEVDSYYRQYIFAKKKLEQQKQKLELDKKNSDYYLVRYQYGKNELRDYIIALNTEQDSQRAFLQQMYEVRKYENMVYKAMAGRYSKRKIIAPKQ